MVDCLMVTGPANVAFHELGYIPGDRFYLLMLADEIAARTIMGT